MSLVKKLLIVDDSRVSRMMIRARAQSAHPDWEIFEAANGEEAFLVVDLESPDFISMDINMPGLSGLDAATHIRNMGSTACVVIFTANIQQSSRNQAKTLGLEFVQKPANEAAVHQMLSHFLKASNDLE